MNYIVKMIWPFCLCLFTSSANSQDHNEIRLIDGYIVDCLIQEKDRWPIGISYICDSVNFVDTFKPMSAQQSIDYMIDSYPIVPVEFVPGMTMLKMFLKEKETTILPKCINYTSYCNGQFSKNKSKCQVILNDTSKLVFEYARFYGFVIYLKKDNELYEEKINCGTIDYSIHPNLKLCLPIISGFQQEQ